MEDAKRYGALPFAGLARAGFIAVQLLKSLVSVGVFSEEDYDNFLAGVNTVSGDLNEDRIILDKEGFLNKYGHLRPGTYEITSPKYSDASDLYFDWSSKSKKNDNKKEFSLNLNQMLEIASLLNDHQIDSDPIELLEFIKSAIEYRELSKFHFTKNISDILSLIQNLGSDLDIKLNELSYLEFQSLISLHLSSMDHKSTLISVINNGVKNYSITNKIHLPPVITDPNDIWSYKMPDSIPNFITQKNVTANIALLTQGNNLNSNIVLITNADPGFDWIFSHSISGLITMWGGINSHMAIRAGELGVPAVIGVGELKFDALKKATVVSIDCSGKRIEIIK